MPDYRIILLIFLVIFLVVILASKAAKKVNKDRATRGRFAQKLPESEKPRMTEEQFELSWKALSYLLILAALGNLYMVFTSVRSAFLVSASSWVFWVDAVASLAAAVAAVLVWRTREKVWVFVYFMITIIPIFLFMSLKGTAFKVGALIHLFPLVLLYFVLRPIWTNMKN